MKLSYIFSIAGSLFLAVGSTSAYVNLSELGEDSVEQTEISNAPSQSQAPENDAGLSGLPDTQQVLSDALSDVFQLYTDWDEVPDDLDVGGDSVLLAIDISKAGDLMETEAAAISARARGIRGDNGGGGQRRVQQSEKRRLGIRGIRGIREGEVCVTTGMITACL